MYKFIFGTFLLVFWQFTYAQYNLPVIKASSKNVDIRDGLHFKKGYWYIMPERKPDYYFVEIPGNNHKVSFITDQDSISFDTKYGEDYDFIILLNNKDSCHTRIAARYKKIVSYTSNHSLAAHDTIPFTIGNNSKIYFKGRINNSEPLNIQFDLGAGGCIVKKSSVKKIKMNFDGSINLTNSDGTNVVPTSSSNTLQVAGLTWDSLLFAVADNMTNREDLLAGNILFQNKAIEINYDKKIIIVHDTLPLLDAGYSKHDMILEGVVPFLQGSLTIGSTKRTGWYMFDTGAYTSILSTNEVSGANKIFIEIKKMFGLSTVSPQLTIGDHAFADFNYTVQKNNGDAKHLGLLGNDLLKRFNVILDNKNGFIYLKQNSLVNEHYANPEYWVVRVATIVLVLIIALFVFIIYRRRKKRRISFLN
jgi:hypothetical protein